MAFSIWILVGSFSVFAKAHVIVAKALVSAESFRFVFFLLAFLRSRLRTLEQLAVLGTQMLRSPECTA